MIENSPIFITGTWRCGSTLVSRMLNAHPDINLIYDGVHILNFISEQDIYKNKIANINLKTKRIKSIVKNRFNKKIDIKFSNTKDFYKSILIQLSNDSLKKICGEKSNVQWRNISKFFKIFPNGRVLHIIRDPRAVLSSWKNFTYSKGDRYLDSIFNSYDSMRYAKIYEKKFNKKSYCLIKYEDLVENPEKFLKKIMKKFKIKYSDKMINFENYQDNSGKKWTSNSSYSTKAYNSIYKQNINKWKNKLTHNEIYLCEILLEKIMNDFGYKINLKQKKNRSNEVSFKKYCDKLFKNSFLRDALIQLIFHKKGQERFPIKNR